MPVPLNGPYGIRKVTANGKGARRCAPTPLKFKVTDKNVGATEGDPAGRERSGPAEEAPGGRGGRRVAAAKAVILYSAWNSVG